MYSFGPYNREVHLHTNGISDLSLESYSSVVRSLKTTFKCHCAMVGHNLRDVDAIRESNIGISVADAADCTKSESDLVLTQPVQMPLPSAVRISRYIFQIMRVYTVYAVSSTIHIMRVGVRLLLPPWNFNLACSLTLMISAFHHCTSFVMLLERAKRHQSPDRWKVKKIVARGAALGSYIIMSTTIFFGVASNLLPFGYRGVSQKGCDEEMKAPYFFKRA